MRPFPIILTGLLILLNSHSCSPPGKDAATDFSIEKSGDNWIFLKDGDPFYVKGAVALQHLDALKQKGGNTIRIWGRYDKGLEDALKHGLFVNVSLPVSAERYGMDWNDTAMVEENISEVLEIVKKYKDHPSVMLWGIGNEIDWIPPGIPYNPKLWDWVDEIAQRIKKIDPHHPVLTVIGDSEFDKKTKEIATQCPSLDLVGINMYGDFSDKVNILKKNWGKAYMVTEWGPYGHWMRPYTEWGAPMEESSAEKAASYRYTYSEVILKDKTHCLGSFVFLWGQKQEITHTWYGMYSKDSLKSEAVDVMEELWTGKPPENTAPVVSELLIDGKARQVNLYLEPGKSHEAGLIAHDKEDDLAWYWEIKPEVDPAPYAGQGEVPAEPLEGLINDTHEQTIVFKTPSEEGAYRIFGYAYDGKGNWGYANYPFFVKITSK